MKRDMETLKHIAEGETIKSTCEIMGISRSTVEKHLYAVRDSLGARTLAHAVHIATKHGLLCVMIGLLSLGNFDDMRRAPRPVATRIVHRESII